MKRKPERETVTQHRSQGRDRAIIYPFFRIVHVTASRTPVGQNREEKTTQTSIALTVP